MYIDVFVFVCYTACEISINVHHLIYESRGIKILEQVQEYPNVSYSFI